MDFFGDSKIDETGENPL
jgi:uncharacterized protein with gpF-like domain